MSDEQSTNSVIGSATLRKIMNSKNIHRVVPIISNSFYINEVLREEEKLIDPLNEKKDAVGQSLTADERLTKMWSETDDVHYPLTDGHDLARVAQYHQVQEELPVAKGNYLGFRKSKILEINREITNNIRQLDDSKRFSEIVDQLGYASKIFKDNDPLDKLAEVPFLNYVTTGYHDFIERALVKAGKIPVTQYVRLDDTQNIITAPILDQDWNILSEPILDDGNKILVNVPDPVGISDRYPVVYHLFGLEKEPESLVLSEDDHVRLLIAVITALSTVNTNSESQKSAQTQRFPMGLRNAISGNNLILLGYQLQNWDFRILFRLLLELRSQQKTSIFLQIPPRQNAATLLEYITQYFDKQFDVEQKSPIDFVQEIWKIYDNSRPRIQD